MSGVNKVILIGRLGKDPELKTISGGKVVAKMALATSESWVNGDGSKNEKTEWHNLIVWGKQAELCGKYLAKGKQIYVEGKLQTRNWENQEGKKQYTTEVVVNQVQFLSPPTEQAAAPVSHEFSEPPAFDDNSEIPF